MKKKILYLFVIAFVFCNGFVFAGYTEPPAPTSRSGGPGGDTGTPGAQASPIDMYVFVLAIVAILFIVHFAKKYRAQKSIN